MNKLLLFFILTISAFAANNEELVKTHIDSYAQYVLVESEQDSQAVAALEASDLALIHQALVSEISSLDNFGYNQVLLHMAALSFNDPKLFSPMNKLVGDLQLEMNAYFNEIDSTSYPLLAVEGAIDGMFILGAIEALKVFSKKKMFTSVLNLPKKLKDKLRRFKGKSKSKEIGPANKHEVSVNQSQIDIMPYTTTNQAIRNTALAAMLGASYKTSKTYFLSFTEQRIRPKEFFDRMQSLQFFGYLELICLAQDNTDMAIEIKKDGHEILSFLDQYFQQNPGKDIYEMAYDEHFSKLFDTSCSGGRINRNSINIWLKSLF